MTIPPQAHLSPVKKPFVSASQSEMVNIAYFTKEADKSDPLASPVFLSDELDAFPPLLVITAEHDAFLPSIDYFVALDESRGVKVEARPFEGVDHDFYFAAATPKPLLESLIASIRDHLLTHLR